VYIIIVPREQKERSNNMKRVNFRGFTEREVKLLEYALKLKCNQSNLSDEVYNEYYDLYTLTQKSVNIIV
jgi:hypothetical protein